MKSLRKNRRKSYIPDSSPFEDFLDEYMYTSKSDEDYKLLRPQSRKFNLAPCNSSDKGMFLSNVLLKLINKT